MRRFAKTVVKVLLSYVEIVKIDFPEQMKTERIVSSLDIFLFLQGLINFLFIIGLRSYE